MIYLKQIFNGRSTPAIMALSLTLLTIVMQVESTKIAYKKPLLNAVKDKHSTKAKINEDSKSTETPTLVTSLTTMTTTTTTTSPATTTTTDVTTMHEELDVAETTHGIKAALSAEEKQHVGADVDHQHVETANVAMTSNSMEFREVGLTIENVEENQLDQNLQSSEHSKRLQINWVEAEGRPVIEQPLTFEEVSTISAVTAYSIDSPPTAPTPTSAAALATIVNSSTTTTSSTVHPTTSSTPPTTPSNRPVPCTCGVFMTSQIKRTGNPYETPKGRPVIMNELDRTYPCNAVGQKQCQTKCLETIVQHLPNSATILCASLDHDIRKERAYLFIKNCRSQWFNTNLAAGREYCCKNGQPYQCPLV